MQGSTVEAKTAKKPWCEPAVDYLQQCEELKAVRRAPKRQTTGFAWFCSTFSFTNVFCGFPDRSTPNLLRQAQLLSFRRRLLQTSVSLTYPRLGQRLSSAASYVKLWKAKGPRHFKLGIFSVHLTQSSKLVHYLRGFGRCIGILQP